MVAIERAFMDAQIDLLRFLTHEDGYDGTEYVEDGIIWCLSHE